MNNINNFIQDSHNLILALHYNKVKNLQTLLKMD